MTDCVYRTRDEVQEVRQTRDPITGFRDRIVGAGLAEITELKAIEVQVGILYLIFLKSHEWWLSAQRFT